MKRVQEQIQKYVSFLAELKKETETTLKNIQEDKQQTDVLRKEMQKQTAQANKTSNTVTQNKEHALKKREKN